MYNLNQAAKLLHMDLANKFVEHAKKNVGKELDGIGKFLLDMRTFLEENYDIKDEPSHECFGHRDMRGQCFVCGKFEDEDEDENL